MTATTTLVGNLTRDPEVRYTASGKAVASFSLAVNRRFQVNGEWEEKVSFFNVTAWDQLGENVSKSLIKGMRAIVTGRLEQREYETNDGEKRTAIELVADEVGAALRFATADVTRTTNDNGSSNGNDRGSQRASSGNARRGAGGPQQPLYGDEEPF